MTLLDGYRIAQQRQIRVLSYDMNGLESASVMASNGKCGIAIDPFMLRSEQDEKIKLAHELGHCVTGAFYNIYSTCDIRERHEARAERWAFKQLVPYVELMAAVEKGYTELWELAEYFDVPESIVRKAAEYYQAGNR